MANMEGFIRLIGYKEKTGLSWLCSFGLNWVNSTSTGFIFTCIDPAPPAILHTYCILDLHLLPGDSALVVTSSGSLPPPLLEQLQPKMSFWRGSPRRRTPPSRPSVGMLTRNGSIHHILLNEIQNHHLTSTHSSLSAG